MKILLVQNSPTVRDKVVFALESTFGAQIAEASNYTKAKEQLSQGLQGSADLVICDLQQQGSVQDFENFQHEVGKLPVILCVDGNSKSEPPVGWHVLSIVDRNHLISDLLRAIQKLVDSGELVNTAEEGHAAGDFVKIRTKLLLSVCPLKADIYIRLSEVKYLKLFKQGDRFDFADMEKYTIRKGVEYLYMKRGDVSEFIDKYNTDLEQMGRKTIAFTPEDLSKVSESIFETVRELGQTVGFTKDVQVMARHHMRMTVKSMGRSPKLGDILAKLKLFEGEYISAHSTLTSFLACAIASHMEWASEGTFAKLTMAAFMHDITLKNIELAECESLTEVKHKGFSLEDQKEFAEHPQKAAEQARQFHEVPPDVDVIIVQHHERPDGKGFPRGLTANYIAPLTCVFLVAHDMAKAALKRGSAFDLKEYADSHREKYSQNQFKKIFAALEHLDMAKLGG